MSCLTRTEQVVMRIHHSLTLHQDIFFSSEWYSKKRLDATDLLSFFLRACIKSLVHFPGFSQGSLETFVHDSIDNGVYCLDAPSKSLYDGCGAPLGNRKKMCDVTL